MNTSSQTRLAVSCKGMVFYVTFIEKHSLKVQLTGALMKDCILVLLVCNIEDLLGDCTSMPELTK